MKSESLPKWLFPAIAVCVLLSLFSIAKRHQVEAHNKGVSFAAEYETVEALAAAQGWTIERALVDLKQQGMNAMVLSEETLADLIGQGKVTLTTTELEVGKDRPNVTMSGLRFNDLSEQSRIEKALQIRFKNLLKTPETRGNVMGLPPVSPVALRATAVGLNPSQVAIAQKANLIIIARCSNPAGASSYAVSRTLGWAHDMGATIFLPQGDQVIGRRESIATTIETLRDLPMLYATPEFAKIGGDTEVVEKAKEIVVRLHAAQAAELDKLPEVDAVERYAKAARERNMRILLIRPLTFASDEPLSSFALFMKKINRQIEHEGGKVNAVGISPKPFTEPGVPKLFFPIFGLALASVVWACVANFVTDKTARMVGAGLLALLGLACYVKSGQQAMSFLASVAFPVLAFIILDKLRPKNVVVGFAIVSLISLVGGLAVAAMLNGLAYYVKADEFRATKVSVFLPILAGGWLFFRSLVDWRSSLKSPVTWGSAGLGIMLLVAFAFMLARTGNDSGVGASSGEILMRNFLDRFLYVRPRTKEFMVGHPLLMVGIGLLSTFRQNEKPPGAIGGWTALLLMIGAMGQSDVVNTLTHLHIPVLLSIARIVEGWVLGGLIGFVAWFFIQKRFFNSASTGTVTSNA